jgi:site-specific DNA recombinase
MPAADIKINTTIRAVIYARFSSDKQDDMSIDAQVRACREYAAKMDMLIVKVYKDEAISGKGSATAKRTQYQRMLKDADNDLFDVVLVHKYDRIARNVGEHVNLELKLSDQDIRLVAVAQDFGSSKEAKIMKTLVWAMSEFYIDNLSEETKKGHKEIALKGLHNGGYAPFGYDIVDQRYVINESEAEYVRKMFRCAAERKGFSELVSEMQLAGIVGKRGKPIKYTQIYEILRNIKYTGVYTYSTSEEKDRSLRRVKPNAIKIENALPRIIDRALYDEVQNIMNERKQTGTKAGYLCSGLVYCGHCGAKMHGMTSRRKGHEYQIYYCSAKCGIGTVRMELIDNTVISYIKMLLSPETIDEVTRALWSYAHNESRRIAEYNASVRKQIGECQAQIDNYMQTLGSGVLPNELISDIGSKIVALKNKIKTLSEMPIPKDYTVAQTEAWFRALREAPSDRKTVELLVERIEAAKTEVNVISTLASVLGETGCGGTQHILPTILFGFFKVFSDIA